jgi:hypothetical protein
LRKALVTAMGARKNCVARHPEHLRNLCGGEPAKVHQRDCLALLPGKSPDRNVYRLAVQGPERFRLRIVAGRNTEAGFCIDYFDWARRAPAML